MKNKNNERGLDLLDIKILELLEQCALGLGANGSIEQNRNFRKRHKLFIYYKDGILEKY